MDNQALKISSSAMLSEAAERMKVLGVNRLSVVEDKDVIGVVTDGDIATAASAGLDLTRTPVKYGMTLAPTEGRPEDALAHAATSGEDD